MIILAIQHQRNGMVACTPSTVSAIQGRNEIRRDEGRIEGVGSAIRFISGIPEQKVGSRLDVIDLLCHRCLIHVCATDMSVPVQVGCKDNLPSHVVHQIEPCLLHLVENGVENCYVIKCGYWVDL